jgi:hypothetical protein
MAMQSFTITARSGRIWWIAAAFWGLAVVLGGIRIGVLAFVNCAWPDVLDWILLASIPALLSLCWLFYVRFTIGQRARRLTAYDWGVSIERFGSRITNLRWAEIGAIDYHSLDNTVLRFKTATEEVSVLGDGFSDDDWAEWLRVVEDNLPEHVDFSDIQFGFEQRLTTWLDRASIGFAVVGIVATAGLLLWNPMNAAALVVFAGTIPVLIYLGNQAIVDDEGPIPIARVIGFFATKLLAIVPVAMIVAGLIQPQGLKLPVPKNWVLFYVSNLMFFSGMASALIVRGGFSPERYYREALRGVNRYHRLAFAAALAVCVIGFMLKAWNEK